MEARQIRFEGGASVHGFLQTAAVNFERQKNPLQFAEDFLLSNYFRRTQFASDNPSDAEKLPAGNYAQKIFVRRARRRR